jgi:uncharacterized protein YjbI with pentapeptide repeats
MRQHNFICWLPCLFARFVAVNLTVISTSALLFADDRTISPPRKTYQKSLSFRKLEGKSFANADLRDTEMSLTHFKGANLRGANFTNSAMDRAELMDADLSHAVGLGTVDFGLGIDAQRANFQHADLRNARLPGTYFENADFRGANLNGAFLAGRFHDAKFDDADVRDAVMLGAAGIEKLHDDLRARGALVDANDFVQAVRAGRDFSGCHLDGFQLAKANLDAASFQSASLHSANLEGASLRGASISDANICWAKLSNAKLSDSNLILARLIGADLTGADLTKAKCRGATFAGAKLRGAKLIGADLTNADFRNADLSGVDLTGAILDGVKWEAAIIADLIGVNPQEQSELNSKAARWKYDLADTLGYVRRAFSFPAWLICWVAGAIVLVRGLMRNPRELFLLIFAGLHSIAAFPAFAFVFLIVAGASPTVQLSGSYSGWSAWVHLWPLAYGVSLLALASFVPLSIIVFVTYFRCGTRGMIKYLLAATLLTGLALLAAVGTMIGLAPSA